MTACRWLLLLVLLAGMVVVPASANQGLMELSGSKGEVTQVDLPAKQVWVDGQRWGLSPATRVVGPDGTPMSMILLKPGMIVRYFIDPESVKTTSVVLSKLKVLRK